MKPKSYWIKERHNPQLGVYYVKMGRITQKEATRYTHTAYGTNIMHKYDSDEAYISAIAQLIRDGHRVF